MVDLQLERGANLKLKTTAGWMALTTACGGGFDAITLFAVARGRAWL
ncbi:MAG: hypothetical protein SF339_22745 [Blastocatellia bacterium]|nr:hypothetical protein [Blastocatellia bacterium]